MQRCVDVAFEAAGLLADNAVFAVRRQRERGNALCAAARTRGRDGGIGRRAGLKIQFWQQSGGSIPPPGTKLKNDGPDLGPFSFNSHSARGYCVVYGIHRPTGNAGAATISGHRGGRHTTAAQYTSSNSLKKLV